MTSYLCRVLIVSTATAALMAAPAFAGTTPGSVAACSTQTVTQASINSPTGMSGNTAASTGQSMNGQAPAATGGVKGINGQYIAGTNTGGGVKGIDGQIVSGTATNSKGVKGLDGQYINGTGQQAVSYNSASVGGMGSNGGNGELNLNNGGMAGAMDDTGSTKGGSKGPDGGANYLGSTANMFNSDWGHPENGKDSHGNTWANDKLVDGFDTSGNEWKNGKMWNGKDDSGTYTNGKFMANFDPTKKKGEPGADTGISDGPGGSSATGATVNTGNHGGNDGGTGNGQGSSGNDGTNAAGMAFNGGGRTGSDAPLGQPKPIEAMNTKMLNNGVTDPCAGSMVH